MSTVNELILRAQRSGSTLAPRSSPALPSFSPRHGVLDDIMRRHDRASGHPLALSPAAVSPAGSRRGALSEIMRRHDRAAEMSNSSPNRRP